MTQQLGDGRIAYLQARSAHDAEPSSSDMPRLVYVIRGIPKSSPLCLTLMRTEIVMFARATLMLGGTQHARSAARTSRTVLIGFFDGSACEITPTIEIELTTVATKIAEARAVGMPCRLGCS